MAQQTALKATDIRFCSLSINWRYTPQSFLISPDKQIFMFYFTLRPPLTRLHCQFQPKMASICAFSAITAIAISFQKIESISRTTKTPFPSGKKLRVRKYTASTTGRLTPVCATADPNTPLWFPYSTPPPWLDGRFSSKIM
ncbi:hypothetical protein SLEP1_g43565 [Rubroshorea leprosula]|uniref:Uncharacterized protein n=1 Tax=Rubroshorea leprosula TaxID=152421 RepID=A0AAV5LDQ7_9ROSI|nr:hypothetical protein SLEP1_g43565 [Rubroshorea leprosula]